jgi:RNA polymerase sigma-70 factor (ECF subfamily)
MGQGELGVVDFRAVYEEDYQRIFRYILSMVRVEAEAQDLTQETFLRAYIRLDTLREPRARTAWLYRIATHAALDRLRQQRRRDPMESESDPDVIEFAEPDAPSLQDGVERGEMNECIQGYVNELTDTYRAVIVLHDMHDLTATEIANLLGESLATVKIRLHRSRLKLRAALQAGCQFAQSDTGLACEPKAVESP